MHTTRKAVLPTTLPFWDIVFSKHHGSFTVSFDTYPVIFQVQSDPLDETPLREALAAVAVANLVVPQPYYDEYFAKIAYPLFKDLAAATVKVIMDMQRGLSSSRGMDMMCERLQALATQHSKATESL